MLVRPFYSLHKISARRWFPLQSPVRSVILQPSMVNSGGNTSETFEEKNARLKRPLSPHLTIYKPQLTTILSITHRVTGLAITGYAVIVAASSSINLSNMITAVNDLQLSSATMFVIKTVLALPVSYHIFNGIRHLIWDSGRGLTIKGVYTTGYVVLVGTIIFSFYLASV